MSTTIPEKAPADLEDLKHRAMELKRRYEKAGLSGVPVIEQLDTVNVGGRERITGTDARWMVIGLAEVLTLQVEIYGAERRLLIGPEGEPYLAGNGRVEHDWLPWLEFEHTWESALRRLERFIDFVEAEGEEVQQKEYYEQLRARLN
ncbi:hypothetical protein BSZ35_00225 [Salinibacter sp. 10B]|uniref:hypothetical protein n=1 Tax=Salinibacter sp. 10B TaxID=1923971 RepID=UPI000CF36DAD|nr:hypothetical protein [Salinibacter sp. 10B]PQJ36815.1 hypothetical protein BSZ35_00225 [Salinibacter sp. 10B]